MSASLRKVTRLDCMNHSKRQHYVCLSHCWGGSQPLRTLKSNLQLHKKSIPWSQIPRTFQDAITWTRMLGIKYIWIDSLCIIQDDNDDWEKESAQMMHIYQSSFLTLAASWSQGSDSGCFADSMEDYPIYQLTALDQQSGIHCNVFARKSLPHWFINTSDRKEFPLLTRGWVFQERLLSPRFLHFGKGELI